MQHHVSQSAGLYDLFDLFRSGCSESLHIRELFVELFHHDIHPRVRTLRRETHAHQKLPCLIVVQCTLRAGIFLFQAADDVEGQFLLPLLFFLQLFLRALLL